MKVLIVSMSTLFIEALQIAIRDRRSTWQVDTYQIQAPIFNQTLLKKIKERCLDIVVIETTNQHFTMIIDSLKKLKSPEIDIMLLVDSRMGEVYHHLKDEERWSSVTKNTSLEEFLILLESFKSNVPDVPDVSLKEMDKVILKELAIGHSFEFIQRSQELSAEEIDQSLYRINTYFKVPNYIESIVKAFEQKIITN
ncbi:glycosidase [Lysinibacillus agricola]|uniref:Glycosidase n=1 Tax=Lysinibacillus agricola TaxID=2590012 RepID=A0ABX7ASS2_9BACI|nr:glycosidase [Lysinibacillus sp. FJAT-14222]QQP13002.1 glycosidase [Lysinibacillus agricola]